MNVLIEISLSEVWRRAEVDFQTFVVVSLKKAGVVSLERGLELEPGLMESEWSLRASEIVALFPALREVRLDRERLKIIVDFRDDAPEGAEEIVAALSRAYVVKSLLALWNELRGTGFAADWRGDARKILERLEEFVFDFTRVRPRPRRWSHFP